MFSQVHQVVFWALRDILLLRHLRFGIRKESIRKRIYPDKHITFSRQWVSLCFWRGRWATVRSIVYKVITQTFQMCNIYFTMSSHWRLKPIQQQFMRVKNICQMHVWQKLLSHNMALSSYSQIDLLGEKNYKFSRIHKHSTKMSGEEWRKLTQIVSSLNSLTTLQIHDQSA